jgi:N-acyl-D-amino-acid deacylase
MGFDDRVPTPSEQLDMTGLLSAALDDGAFALSTGLIYPPSSFGRTDELIDLAEVLRGTGAYYASHVRGEADTLMAAITEALEIGRRADVPVHLSHHKAQGRRNWGKVRESLDLVDQVRSEGRDVTLDAYPYAAGSTTLTAVLPGWVLDGGIATMLSALGDPRVRRQLVAEMSGDGAPPEDLNWQGFDVATIMLSFVPEGPNKRYEHLLLEDVAARRGEEPVETALHLIESEAGQVQIITFSMAEEDVRRVIRHPAVAIASDGWILSPEALGTPHPRNYGTFARVLGAYVREQHLLDLEDAVRKMTSLPAGRLGRRDLGRVEPGCVADLVVFDAATVSDRATFDEPHQFCTGVEHVVVNGQLVIESGRDTGASPGRVLRRGRE